jgi:SAM-dependent methyltransferase
VYRQIVALAGVRPGDAVLDVGCSSGYLARKLAEAAGPDGRVTGVDPSEPAIAYARRRAAPGLSADVEPGPLTTTPAQAVGLTATGVAARVKAWPRGATILVWSRQLTILTACCALPPRPTSGCRSRRAG